MRHVVISSESESEDAPACDTKRSKQVEEQSAAADATEDGVEQQKRILPTVAVCLRLLLRVERVGTHL